MYGRIYCKSGHLSHRYSIQWAIRDINIEITRNGIYGLLGFQQGRKINHDEHYLWGVETDGGEVYIKGINLRGRIR